MFASWVELRLWREVCVADRMTSLLSRVCLSNTNPGGLSGWERLWAAAGHEHSEEGQEDPWLFDFGGRLRSDGLHRHYWGHQVEFTNLSVYSINCCVYLVCRPLPRTRDIFPEGLPPSYVFIATLRLKGTSSRLTFDLWRVLSKDKEIQVAVTLSGKDKSVVFTTTSLTAEEQRVTFRGVQVGVGWSL